MIKCFKEKCCVKMVIFWARLNCEIICLINVFCLLLVPGIFLAWDTKIAFCDQSSTSGDIIRSALTPGWDVFNEPLSSGEVVWNVSGNQLEVMFQLRGARPNHTYTVGSHLFDSKPFSVKNFLGYTLGSNANQQTKREGKTAYVVSYDFGNLTTDSQGNGTASFSGSVPPGRYPLQFTVRIGECQPSKGVTTGCASVYRTGKRFGEYLEQVIVGGQ